MEKYDWFNEKQAIFNMELKYYLVPQPCRLFAMLKRYAFNTNHNLSS